MAITMTEEEYMEHIDGSSEGYCTHCDAQVSHGCVEPDAENYPCPDCNESTVMGIEQALLMGHIEIKD